VSYEADGYLHLAAVYPADQVETLRADLDGHTGRDGTWKDGRQKKGGLSIQPDVHQRPLWRAASVALLPTVRDVLQAPPECYASLAIIKPKETGQRFPWH